MLFIPYKTDTPMRRMPWVNYGLVAINVLIFAAMVLVGRGRGLLWAGPYMIWPTDAEWYQFFTYQFLHGDVVHLGGNLLFLWVFGGAVNAKLGQARYGVLYLGCGVLAGLGFLASGEQDPCVGASGAIAGITTAYLVLFPRSVVFVFYWLLYFVGTFAMNAVWLIVGKMIVWDNLVAMQLERPGMTTVAYSAHLAGYAAGFILALLMLLLRAAPRDQFDLLAVWRRAYQRRIFAATMADPAARARAIYGRVAQPVDDAGRPMPEARPPEGDAALRGELVASLSAGDLEGACERYGRLMAMDPEAVLARDHQLHMANALMSRGRYEDAAQAYEGFLRRYPASADVDRVKLMLGIIYARYLQRREAARRYLGEAIEHLTSPDQKQQAAYWLRVATASPQVDGA